MLRFLIGRPFYCDAANTIFAFMGVYATKEVGFSDLEAQLVLLIGVLGGPVGALLAGRAVDRRGAKLTLQWLLVLWMIVLAICAIIPLAGLPSWLFWLVTPFGGIAFGGTSSADRALLLQLAPPEHIGQFSGIFNMVGRFSAILGPLLWSLEVSLLGWGRPVAVATLAIMVLVSAVCFRPIRNTVASADDVSTATAQSLLAVRAYPARQA